MSEWVNSEAYWSARFANGDWEAKLGREQTRFFARLAIEHIHPAILDDIHSCRPSVCDWGCALGDAVPILAEAFGSRDVLGVDFVESAVARATELHPGYSFRCASEPAQLGREFDVVFTSNTLEHLERPLDSMARLAVIARRYLIVLVPFLEHERIEEHLSTFDDAAFPLRVGSHQLVAATDLDTTHLQPTFWSGRQMLAVYAREGAGALDLARLSWLAPPSSEGYRQAVSGLKARVRELADRGIQQSARAEAEAAQLRAELDRAVAKAAELKRELGLAEAELDRVQQLAGQHQRVVDAIHSSVAWRAVTRYRALRDRVAAPGTLRRRGYDFARRALQSPGYTVEDLAAALRGSRGPGQVQPADGQGQRLDIALELARFRRRSAVRHAGTLAAIFATTRLLDDEGQRPTRIAFELARRGIPVVFVYWRWSTAEVVPQDRLHEGILQLPIDAVVADPDALFGAFEAKERVVLFEFPHPSFFEPLAAAHAAGWVAIYDVLDDWEEFHRVGQAIWWDEAAERHLIASADAVFAVNPLLAERIRSLGGSSVEINANGLRPEIAQLDRPRQVERGEVTVGYFGYLAGAWFDWTLIAAAARARPEWRFYLIGYGGSPEGVDLPCNVVLLGKKPFTELASYAASWDVAVVPFKPDRLAAGADPIKTYEYLALGLPVVVTGVPPPTGAEGLVRRAEGLDDFITQLAAAAGERDQAAARRAYAAGNTWEARVDRLLDAIRRGEQRIGTKRALFASTAAGAR